MDHGSPEHRADDRDARCERHSARRPEHRRVPGNAAVLRVNRTCSTGTDWSSRRIPSGHDFGEIHVSEIPSSLGLPSGQVPPSPSALGGLEKTPSAQAKAWSDGPWGHISEIWGRVWAKLGTPLMRTHCSGR